jgi:hypothetical protein
MLLHIACPSLLCPLLQAATQKNRRVTENLSMCFLTNHMHAAQQCIFGLGEGVLCGLRRALSYYNRECFEKKPSPSDKERAFCGVVFVMIVKVSVEVNLF